MVKTHIGTTVIRKEAWNKVTGEAKYTNDFLSIGTLTARIVTSMHAHAMIITIDTYEASILPGVKAILTGAEVPILCGTLIEDRPPLAKEKVRYYGEPVCLIVADNDFIANKAVNLIKIKYDPLPVINSPAESLKQDATLLHENLGGYRTNIKDIYPEAGTNICDKKQIRKGDILKGFRESNVILEASFSVPQSDHIAMETRSAQAEISSDGTVFIRTSSQAPHGVRKLISKTFGLDEGKVIVEVPFVGGGFGGKAPVQLEILAYLASKSVGGKKVRLNNTRENDISTSPCKMGLEAKIKMGVSKEGKIKAAQMTFLVDTGAYSDIGPRLAKAIAVDCSGPYNIENLHCDSLCVYTNHSYATSYRGFGHASSTFCIERMIDKIAQRLNIDAVKIRKINALSPNDLTPTQVKVTRRNLGDLAACIDKVKFIIDWDEGDCLKTGDNKIRAKGIASFWKTSDSPPDAVSGVFLSFNSDGSININCGCVEYGPAMKTTITQILAERLKMDIDRIHINMYVNTKSCPEHWKTVASMTTYMMGRAVLRAADDIERQLKSLAATILRYPPEALDIEEERVYLKSDPAIFLSFKDLAHGYQYQNGNSVMGQILGRGSFIMGGLSYLDRETGKGKAGPYWTVGVQGVELEFDTRELTYRLIKAVTVIDAGKVLNPQMARALIRGGMCMGLGLGSRESFNYNDNGILQTTSLRTYKVMHVGETPQYYVDFIETPEIDSPYGARGIAEHGIIGIPAALANALSKASGTELDQLPLDPETIWRIKTGGIYDPI